MRPSWTSIPASRRLTNRKRSVACRPSRSPSPSGGGGSKWATRSPNDRRLKPSTAPCGIHDSEVTEDSIRMAACQAGSPVSQRKDPEDAGAGIRGGLDLQRSTDGAQAVAHVDESSAGGLSGRVEAGAIVRHRETQ